MRKQTPARTVVVISAVLIIAFFLSACGEARLPAVYTYNPGAAFTTNINDEDPRRQLRTAIIFEVIDDAAAAELSEYNFVIRNAVITVLSSLTLEELTTNKDIQGISDRLVEQINEAIISHIDLVIGAYFTEFTLN